MGRPKLVNVYGLQPFVDRCQVENRFLGQSAVFVWIRPVFGAEAGQNWRFIAAPGDASPGLHPRFGSVKSAHGPAFSARCGVAGPALHWVPSSVHAWPQEFPCATSDGQP